MWKTLFHIDISLFFEMFHTGVFHKNVENILTNTYFIEIQNYGHRNAVFLLSVMAT